ncbi:MAG: hypothetical protein FJX75_20950 [Armatimonadetes bacterium]|nr:hypothetical protein [Armatimonadota bacterium]
MLRAVLIVLFLVVVCAYVALFLSWNATPQPVTMLQMSGSKYEQAMPIGLLFIVGVLVGAGAMALALWNPWNNLKAAELQQRELVQRAKSKLKSQQEKIKELSRDLQEQMVQADVAETARSASKLSPEVEAAAAEVDSAPEGEKADTASPEDDPEVI